MKLTLLLFALLSTLVPAAPPKTPPKPAAPAPVPAPASTAELDAAVRARIEAFFTHIAGGRLEEAYARLFEGSIQAKEQSALVPTFVNNTKQILEKCGPAENGAVLRVRSAGRTLKEVTCILNCKKQPIRWTFYAYFGDGRWQVLDAEPNLDVASFFEPAKADKGN